MSKEQQEDGAKQSFFDAYMPKSNLEAALLGIAIIGIGILTGGFGIPVAMGGYIGYKHAKAKEDRNVPLWVFIGMAIATGPSGIVAASIATVIGGVVVARGLYNGYREQKLSKKLHVGQVGSKKVAPVQTKKMQHTISPPAFGQNSKKKNASKAATLNM